MFKKTDITKLNEVIGLSSKVLRVLYLLLISLAFYIILIFVKETHILNFLLTIVHIVSPLFIGLLIAWLFDPFVNFLERKGIKRIWGSVITYVLIFGVFFIVLSSLIPLLVTQVKDFISSVPSVLKTLKGWAEDFFKMFSNNDFINANKMKREFFSYTESLVSSITTTMPKNFLGFVSNFLSGIGTVLLGFIIGFFLIVNFDSSRKLFKFIPVRFRESVFGVASQINDSLRNYVKGAVLDSLLIFALSSIGLWICGLKSPILFGLFCGLTNIIPYAGPYIGGAPAVIVGLTQDIWVGVFVLIVIAVIQFLEGNFLQPYIMSKTTKLHPVTIILGLLVFGHFFGIIGMLISTPVISVCKILIKFLNDRYEFIKESREA